ncbi:Panacea domain-containing protein [Agrobacterium tumefaciens]|uniref:Panacea domain-containing protein n=1 Tax=Agrobacterium tumefaciens TaxID=358 RepID=UPI000DDAC512
MASYTADQIARYLLSLPNEEDNDISNLKLQKLCYYAHGVISSMRGEPLINEDPCAWDHGPVFVGLYHKYKEHGSQPIPVVSDFDVSEIDEMDRHALDDVYDYYSQFSPWRLRNMTHEEKPWIDAYQASSGKRMPLETLTDFFAPQIDEEYAEKLYGKAKAR